jgi:trehalose 6-phosphate phosphatase
VHAAAWKSTFDRYLKEVSERSGKPFEPFEINPDYYRYVDGKPRYDGVDSFLRSRGIVLEWGHPNDTPDRETVCGLGNRKNGIFNEVLKFQGVEVFRSSVSLIRELRARGSYVAVVTSSKNCAAVLEAAGIQDLFDARVDGNVAAEKKLAGKPAPETYEEAVRMLGVPRYLGGPGGRGGWLRPRNRRGSGRRPGAPPGKWGRRRRPRPCRAEPGVRRK